LKKGNEEVIDRAKSALQECIKAGCDILRPIATKVREKASETTTLPTIGSMTEVMRLMSNADDLHKKALKLAENDKLEGFNILKDVITKYEEAERKAKEIVNGHQKATELAFGQRIRQQWQIIVAIAAAILAAASLIVAIIALRK